MSYADLLAAFEWVSSAAPLESAAFVSRETGVIYWSSDSMEELEELPENLEDESLYAQVPGKVDLDLGSRLALRFIDRHLPEAHDIDADFFRRRGAYGRFKDFLERRNLLQAWYDFEENAVERALREWAEEQGLQLKP